jgi:hypothetical protein
MKSGRRAGELHQRPKTGTALLDRGAARVRRISGGEEI